VKFTTLSLVITTVLSSPGVFAQVSDTTEVSPLDSVPADTTVPPQPIRPIPHLGTLDRDVLQSQIIPDSSAYFGEYSSLNDIIVNHNGAFVRDLGSVGQYSELTLGGLGGRHIAYLQDGIVLNEPLTGIYNPCWLQTEQIDRVEVETGTRSFLYGFNSTGGAINAVSRHYKAIRPMTKIRYSESRYEQTFFDGMFSQNLTRNLNVTGGVERYVTDGRFSNSDFDMWGTRVKARFDASDRWNFFFSEHYTQTKLGLFGGINYNATANTTGLFYDPRQAVVTTTDVYEKITRHDTHLGVAAQLFDDSTDITTLTAYYTTHLRELRDENNRPFADSFSIFDNHHSRLRGVKLTHDLQRSRLSVNLGGEMQSRDILLSPATGNHAEMAINAFGRIGLSPFEQFRLSGYARYDHYGRRSAFSVGGDLSLSPLSWLRLYAGYSRSTRFPTFQELYWRRGNIDGPNEPFANERHHLFESGVECNIDSIVMLSVKYFRRTIGDHITTFSAGPSQPFIGVRFIVQDRSVHEGVSASAHLRLWCITAEGHASYLAITQSLSQRVSISNLSTLQPEWWALGGIYYRNKLFDESLDLKVGIRGKIYGDQQGMEFNPEAIAFVPSSLPSIGIGAAADAVLIAKIGPAYVHFLWQNLVDNNYIVTPFYPMPDRAVRFGITWVLFD